MAQINNKEVMQKLAETANIQIAKEAIPNQLSEKIVASFETNPKLVYLNQILGSGSSIVTGTLTVLTANVNSADKKTFVTGIDMGYIKDAACDVATGVISLSMTPFNQPIKYIYFPVLTLTAQNENKFLLFDHPIRLHPGTGISFAVTFAAGNLSRNATVFGYQEDN